MENLNEPTYLMRGFVIGLLVAILMWIFPIPIAAFVWLFDIKRPFVDVMFMLFPLFLAMPVLGAMVGSLRPRRTGGRRSSEKNGKNDAER